MWEVDKHGNLSQRVEIDEEVQERLETQLSYFHEVFGRKPRSRDYVFLEKYVDDPKRHWFVVREAAQIAGVDSHLAFASEVTGRFLTAQNEKNIPDVDIDKWHEAADAYYALQERGIDPYLTLDFRSVEEAALVICAHEALEAVTIHLGSFIDKTQRRRIREVAHLFVLYFASRAFNAAKTIYNVTRDMEARELVGVARVIYECYVRIKYLRIRPEAAEEFAAQASVGNEVFRFKELGDGKISRKTIVNRETGQEFRAQIPFATMVAAFGNPSDAAVHKELYGMMSSVGHADASELSSYFDFEYGFFLSPKGSLAEVLMLSLIALAFLFAELSKCEWAPRLALRDAKYIARRTAKGLCKASGALPGSETQLLETLKKLLEIAHAKV